MNKISEFYQKAITDEAVKSELNAILSGSSITEATDEQLSHIGEIAQRLGFHITVEEARDYISGDETELDDTELDAVAGGGKGDHYETKIIVCQVGGKANPDE